MASRIRLKDAATRGALVAHVLAWAAFLWLVLWPNFYQGLSESAVAPGGVSTESTRVTASLLEVNGLQILPILSVPVVLSGLGLYVVGRAPRVKGSSWTKVTIWSSAALLLLFCLMGIFSIGLFYLPSAMALAVTAAMNQWAKPRIANGS